MNHSIKKKVLSVGLVIIFVCAVIIIIVSMNNNQRSKQETEKYIGVEPYKGRDKKEIKEHFMQYPGGYDEIIKYEVPVITAATATNKNMLKDFYRNFQKGKECSLDMITFGVEGGNVYHYLQYNGEDLFYYCFGKEINDVVETFQNIYFFDIPARCIDSYDASKLPEPFQVFVLSTDELSDYDAYEKLSNEISDYNEKEQMNSKSAVEGFEISPFSTEKESKDFLENHSQESE